MALEPPPDGSRWWPFWNALTRFHAALYRLTGGRLGAKQRGVPCLLLHHVGRKSGERRTTPLMYLADGDDLVIVASKGGRATNPAWWLNLREKPSTTVRVGREERAVTARQASPEEKERLWPRLVELYANYDEYRKRTDRDIPVVILRPETPATP